MDVLAGLLAKSGTKTRSPEQLTVHLSATLAAADTLRTRIGRLTVADTLLGAEAFWPAVLLAALTHDAGKVAAGFQDMVAGRTRSWGERHELLSLGFLPALIADETLRRWAAAGVLTHHRALTGDHTRTLQTLYGPADQAELRERLEPIDPEAAANLAGWLAATATRAGLPAPASALPPADLIDAARQVFTDTHNAWKGPIDPDRGLLAVLVQAAVTLADHLSSAHRTLDTGQPLDHQFRTRLQRHQDRQNRPLYPHQRRAALTQGHLLLRAPTGTGKTESGLLWAATQVPHITETTGGIPRVFYTLPYLASINAMTQRLTGLLSELGLPGDIGVAHSRAASYHLATAIADENDTRDGVATGAEGGTTRRTRAARKAVSRAAATRLFRETIRVGTPYQLLRGALAGPAHAAILIDAANSVFVLDELHAYDARRLGYILAFAGLWERLGASIAVLSATLPDALADLIRAALTRDVHPVDAAGLVLPARHRLHLRDHHLTGPAATTEIHRRLAEGDSVLVVANNVGDAQHLFDELEPVARRHHGPGGAHLLHSRYRRRDRSTIEERITNRYRSRQTPRRGGLVVATQVVEVSLDVDFNCLFTSAAALDALLQRFGRVNRIAALPPADVIVHHPKYGPRRGSGKAEYADGVYPRAPVETGWTILSRHHGQTIDETLATSWLNEVYTSPWGQEWRAEVAEHQQQFTNAFLTFTHPFDDRGELSEEFDRLFDGTEAILATDRDAYAAQLLDAAGPPGRLLAEEHLIPMPHWAGPLARYDRDLGIRIIDGDYSTERGLTAIHGLAAATYRPGEVI